MRKFKCCDCGARVLCYDSARVEPRCASCFWIVEHVPPEQQTEVRARLGVPLLDLRAER
jgi:hypothetical protein